MTALRTLAPVLVRTQKAHARSTAKDLRFFRNTTQDPEARRLASARLLKAMHDMGITGSPSTALQASSPLEAMRTRRSPANPVSVRPPPSCV